MMTPPLPTLLQMRAAAGAAEQHLLEVAAELVAHGAVYERVEAAVEEAGPVGGKHGEEELGLLQETGLLQLADQRDGIERGPADQEHHGDQHYHPRHLPRNNINIIIQLGRNLFR